MLKAYQEREAATESGLKTVSAVVVADPSLPE